MVAAPVSNIFYMNSQTKISVFIFQDARAGKIKTESGVWIPASYKSKRYAEWKEKTKIEQEENDDDNEDGAHAPKGMFRS